MGGCSIRENPEKEVIDELNRVKGYENMFVVDASMIPENLGVNPALSITAFAERAMSFIPVKEGGKLRPLKAEKKWGVKELLLPDKKK
jgi:cholesterol oxidase